MNPRKRQALEPLLPTHKPPKLRRRARNGLLERWSQLATEIYTLAGDTVMASVAAVGQAIIYNGHENVTERPPSPVPSPQVSRPSSPVLVSTSTLPPRHRNQASGDQVIDALELHQSPSQDHRNIDKHENGSGLPSPESGYCFSECKSSHPSNLTSFKSSDTEPAPCSNSTCMTSVPSVLSPAVDPPPDELEMAIRKKQRIEQVQRSLAHVRARPHIFEREHKAVVKEAQKQGKEDMLKELHQYHRDIKGYSSDIRSLESYLGYQEQLEGRGLTPSRSLTNLHDEESIPFRAYRHSYPNLSATPSLFHRDLHQDRVAGHGVSAQFLRRALEKAKRTITSPPPPPPFSAHDALRAKARERDETIEQRLRPPKVLPPDVDREVQGLFNKRGTISKIAREQVNDKDISRLRPAQWLNDEIINFYGAMILARSEAWRQKPQANGVKHKKVLDAHYFNTFFWSKLVGEGYECARLAKWTKKFDIFAKDIILIPINHNNAHWTAAAINFRQRRIESYDSMNLDRQFVFNRLRQYLDLEHRNKKGTSFNFEGWTDHDPEDTPQQENGYDCGVFTCQFLESLSRGEEHFNFTQRDMSYFRNRMVWEIAHAKFLDSY